MKRCSWCNRLMLPLTGKSEGGTMHQRCATYVDRITAENQVHYEPWEYRNLDWDSEEMLRQAQLRWEEEDRL
jgi:hypothetical protein